MKPNAHLPDEHLLEPATHDEEEHLRGCQTCQRRRDVQESMKRALSKLDRTAEPSRAALALLDVPAARRLGWRRRFAIALAAAAALAVISVVVLMATRRPTGHLPAPLRDELALDHLHYAPIAEPAQVASSDPKVVSVGLSEKLGRPVVVPSWEATTLLGGRACRIQNEWVSLVLYERAGRRISLFEIPSASVTNAGCDPGEGGLSVCAVPRRGGGAFVAVADLPPHEVSRLLGLVEGS